MGWAQKVCLNTTLVASNVLFFALAVWLLVEGANVRKAGWLDVFEDDYPWFYTAYVAAVISLSVLIGAIAISGLHSVLCTRKTGVVLLYASCTLLTAAICVFLSIEGGISLSTAHSWNARGSLDREIEGRVEDNFNNVYCLAQAGFLCTANANAQWLVHFGSDDLRDLFLDKNISKTIKNAMKMERTDSSARNMLALCEDETSVLHIPVMDEQMASLCTWCGEIADLQTYVHLVSWSNSKCPPKQAAASFCVANVWQNYTKSGSGDVTSGLIETPSKIFNIGTDTRAQEPYAQCRKVFLSYWSYLSLWLLGISVLLLVFMGVVIRVAWLVLRPKQERYSHWQGRKPERKPLVQMGAATGKGATTTKAKAPTAKPKK